MYPNEELLDRWLLSKLEKVTEKAGRALENYQFNIAIEEVRGFTWHVFCDEYIEAVKDRLYRKEIYGEEKRKAAQYTLYNAIYRIIQLLAPFTPHITEEIYQTMYAEDKGYKSIHVSPWPSPNKELIDEEAEARGNKVIALIAEVRRDKARRRLPLNTEIKRLTIYAGNEENAESFILGKDDITGACRAKEVEIIPSDGEGVTLEEFPEIKFKAEY